MDRIANFEKVSLDQFNRDMVDCFGMYKFSEDEIEKMYNNIKLPTRATSGSAGYDFCCPVDIELEPNESVKFPTGIRCRMNEGWFLMMVPRSSLGFKYYCRPANVLPIIDSDYFFSDNEGHIMIKIRNEGYKKLKLLSGERFFQGIFIPFGITDFDNTMNKRNGGVGSTGRQN